MSRFFHVFMTVAVLIGLAISAWGMWAFGVRVPVDQVLPKVLMYALVLAGAAYYRYRKLDQFVAALLIVFWMGLVSDLHVYPMFIAGRQPVPYDDAVLARADQALGLEATDVLAWIADYPAAKAALEKVYYSLVFLMAAALLGTTLLGRLKAAQEYVVSCVCAVAITFPIFAVFQVQGPYIHYGFPASPAQLEYLQVLANLKTHTVYTMDLRYASGIITFPSFHTILALLAGIALWSVPYVRWVALVWSGLIVLSTLTTAMHYVIDLVAGGGVVILSVLGAKAFSWAEAKWMANQERKRLEDSELPDMALATQASR